MTLISVPKPLRDKLGDEASDSLIELFRQKDEEQKFHLFEVLEDKFAYRLDQAVSSFRGEMNSMEKGLRGDMQEMEKSLRGDMQEMEKSLRGDMQEMEKSLRGDMHKMEKGFREEMNSMEKGLREDMHSMEKGLRGDMHSMEKGIRDDMNHGFLDLQKQITYVHEAISSQTKWILAAVLGGITIYPIIQKLLTRF